MTHRDEPYGGDEPPVVVRDRRRIDPLTGAVRTPDPDQAAADPAQRPDRPGPDTRPAGEGAAQPGGDDLRAQLDERTRDLQRITAEYANYRKRVERDREVAATIGRMQVVADLLGVLDDLERAEAHGDLTGAFRAVADKVTAALQKAGLQAYGHEGEPFDPAQHEAVQHNTSPDVDGPTVTAVLRRGYLFGDRVLRPAMVAVTDHEPAASTNGIADDVLLEPEPPGALAHHDGDSDAATRA